MAEVTSEIGRLNLSSGRSGFLREAKRDAIEIDQFEKIHAEHEALRANPTAARWHKELWDKTREYEDLRAKWGRDAIEWTPVRYWLLLLIIMIPEYAINWGSFAKIPVLQNTPAFVFGTVTLVAAAFIFSAHLVGKIVRQWRERFGGQVQTGEKKASVWLLTVAIVLFLVAMGMIFWGRKLLVDDIMRDTLVRKGQVSEVDVLWQYGGALLGNLVVYLIGLGWSLYKHDSVPNFVEVRSQKERLQNKLDKLYQKFLTPRVQRAMLEAQQRIEHLEHEEAEQRATLPGYYVVREKFEGLMQKDNEVVGLMAEYKAQLVGKLQNSRYPVVFLADDIVKTDLITETRFTIDQFAAKPIELKFVQ